MKIMIRRFIVCSLLLLTLIVTGENVYLNKKVLLPGGKITLKVFLKTLSDQTGCVFSYDPTKVIDKVEISTTAGTFSLQTALQKISAFNIQYKMNGKYIVLQKSTSKVQTDLKKNQSFENKIVSNVIATNFTPDIILKDSVIQKTDDKPEFVGNKVAIEVLKDSVETQPQTITDLNIAPQMVNNNPVPEKTSTSIIQVDTISSNLPIAKPNPKSVFELELAAHNHLRTISTHWGLSSVYGILSFGGDYNKSYHMGIGVGTGFKIYQRLGMNIEFTQYALVAGRSRKLNIRAYTSQISPTLNYRIGQHWKIFLGPTLYAINSSYRNGSTVRFLGNYVGNSGIIGLNYNFDIY